MWAVGPCQRLSYVMVHPGVKGVGRFPMHQSNTTQLAPRFVFQKCAVRLLVAHCWLHGKLNYVSFTGCNLVFMPRTKS